VEPQGAQAQARRAKFPPLAEASDSVHIVSASVTAVNN